MQLGFHFDAWRCTGCKTCVMACKDYRDNGTDIAFRQVYEYVGGTWEQGAGGLWQQGGPAGTPCFAWFVSVACNHCARPVCVEVCPTGAMHKDADTGLVSVNARRCVGCGYCALSCPYHAPKVNRELGRSVKCDGCADRGAKGLPPVCVEACPVRALDFGEIETLRQRYGTQADLAPLPNSADTCPSLVITPPKAAEVVPAEQLACGGVANLREVV